MTSYPFRFSPPARLLLAPFGVGPRTASVEVGETGLEVRFGRWRLRTDLDNIAEVVDLGRMNPVRAIGLRLSLVDRGITFGTNADAGVCFRFHRPVPAFEPSGRLRHPGATVTVADCPALGEEVRRRLRPPAP